MDANQSGGLSSEEFCEAIGQLVRTRRRVAAARHGALRARERDWGGEGRIGTFVPFADTT